LNANRALAGKKFKNKMQRTRKLVVDLGVNVPFEQATVTLTERSERKNLNLRSEFFRLRLNIRYPQGAPLAELARTISRLKA
jgi:hypothetical protein